MNSAKIQPKIIEITEKKLVGISLEMSMAENKTAQLFQTFMPRRNEIKNRLNPFVFDLQEYPPNYFQQFNPKAKFRKYALAEVSRFADIPKKMQQFVLPRGKYAVFNGYFDNRIFEYIYSEWLPHSGFVVDKRPHFDILDENQKSGNVKNHQDIYIPVKTRQF